MPDFTLDYLLPHESLREVATFFYEFRSFVDHCEELDRATDAQLRFTLKGKTSIRFDDGPVMPLPDIYVHGPTSMNVTLISDGLVEVIGVGLLPAGWATMVPIDASLAVNQVIDAEHLFGFSLAPTRRAMQAVSTMAERTEIFTALMSRLLRDIDPAARDFTRIVDQWLEGSLSPEVKDLVQATGLSMSQVERNCKRYYGSSPKLLVRKFRALRAAVKLIKGQAELADLVAEGFSDQSHLIREIKHFTGQTPKRFQENAGLLATLTLQRTEYGGRSELISGI